MRAAIRPLRSGSIESRSCKTFSANARGTVLGGARQPLRVLENARRARDPVAARVYAETWLDMETPQMHQHVQGWDGGDGQLWGVAMRLELADADLTPPMTFDYIMGGHHGTGREFGGHRRERVRSTSVRPRESGADPFW